MDVLGEFPERFVMSPADGRIAYAVVTRTGFFAGPFGPPSRLFRTEDAGGSWRLVASPLVNDKGETLGNLAAGASPGLIYAMRMAASSCFTGLCAYEGNEAYVSIDGGVSWKSIDGENRFTRVYPSATRPMTLYGQATRTLFRSDDQGRSWVRIRDFSTIAEIAVDNVDSSTVYVRPFEGTELWATDDAGATWRTTPRLDLPPNTRVRVDPLVAGRVYQIGAGGEVLESVDRGRSWKRAANFSGELLLGNTSGQADFVTIFANADGGRRVFAVNSARDLYQIDLDVGPIVVGSDLWWNPLESGKGFTISQHSSGQMFIVWFAYDASGNPTWRVLPGGNWLDRSTFSGKLYETRGPAFFQERFDPSRISVTPVGNATLKFKDEDHATFSYSMADGGLGVVTIEREMFGPPLEWTASGQADIWYDGTQPGWGLVVNHQYGKAFANLFAYSADGKPTWLVMPDSLVDTVTVESSRRLKFSGELYTTRDPAPSLPFDAARITRVSVGYASLIYNGLDEVIFTYTAFGATETKRLTRQPF